MMFIASKEIKSIKTRNPKLLCKRLFNEGYNYYQTGRLDSAYFFFSECTTFSCFYESLSHYSIIKSNIHDCWVNSVMNKAIILYESGFKKEEACINWNKIVGYDEEAYKLYKTNCQNNE